MGEQDHGRWLARAVELAAIGVRAGAGGPFGCVIVRDGVVLAEGHNQVLADRDPTAHAEMVAIRRACVVTEDHQLTGAVVYTSAEPCPMCLGAIYWARPAAVYYATSHEQAARAGFDDSLIYDEIARPHGERRIPFARIEVPGAEDPFREWTERTSLERY
jgi:guanine deaminase